jgi:hypothetical protein
MQQGLDALKTNVEKILQQTCRAEASAERGGMKALFAGFRQETDPPAASRSASDASAALLSELARWQESVASEDCPLPHLYREAAAESIGQFHDALRRLHDQGKIYLHPWTGPLYDIPEPPYALLIGHEIAYYASIRN